MFWNKTTVLFVINLALGLAVEVVNADFTFGTPTNLGPTVNSPAVEAEPFISADGLSLFFNGDRPGGHGSWDIWVTKRATTEDDWGIPVNLGSTVNSSGNDYVASMTADGLTLFFCSSRSGGYGLSDIYVTTRATKEEPWGTAVNLGPTVNSSSRDFARASADGLVLYIASERSGGFGDSDLWVSTRARTNDPWPEPINLGPPVNSAFGEEYPEISSDGLALFFGSAAFSSPRPGGYGLSDVWITLRKTKESDWEEPVNLGPIVNSSDNDRAPSISTDGSTLYFASRFRPGGYGDMDLWQVSIEPVVDLNGDGVVNSADMTVVVNHWGEDYSSCDIGPMPWGDGVVDVKDLIALSDHLFEDVDDPTLVAHWAVDETEGSIAHEGVSSNADLVMGAALWQPAAGMVGGALELDGVDDCIITGFGLNLADGPFSIFAWVKGGGPGQVVISEPMGTNWLVTDVEGKLMTELKSASRDSTALLSQAVITDGAWHRIGFVWDGSQRMICVDGATVAEDMQDGLETFDTGLYIGVGNDYAPGSLFSGMIDDVRIYNRAVRP